MSNSTKRRPAFVRHRAVLAAGAVVTASVALAACGTNGASGAGTPQPIHSQQFNTNFNQQLVSDAEKSALHAAGGNSNLGGSIDLMWQTSGAENDLLVDLLKTFTAATGTKVNVISDPGLQTDLPTKVQAGDAPDVVIDTSTGALQTFKNLIPLDSFLDMNQIKKDFGEDEIQSLSVNGKLYALPGAVLNMEMWYKPITYAGPTKNITIDDLTSWAEQQKKSGGTAPICGALSSGAFTANNAEQFIETIFTTMYGADAVKELNAGTIKFDSEQYKAALDKYLTWYRDGLVYGGAPYALSQPITKGTEGLLSNPQKCVALPWGPYAESFITQAQPSFKPGTDYSMYTLSGVGSQAKSNTYVQTSTWTTYAFHENPQVKAFMSFFASTGFQTLVASTGHWLMANRSVATSTYPSSIQTSLANERNAASSIVTTPFGTLPASVRLGLFSAVAALIQDPSQSTIDSQLATVDSNYAKWKSQR